MHVLLVGGHEDTIERVASLGVGLTVFQNREMVTPEQIGLATRLSVFDYTQVDEVVAMARAVHAIHPVSAVLSFTEYGLEPAAIAAEALQVAGNPVKPVQQTRNKLAMRQVLADSDIGSTRYRACATLDDLKSLFDEIGGTVIVKPVRGSGSEGIATAERREDLAAAWERSAAAGVLPLMVEEFIDGEEISVETQSMDGRHEVVAVTEKLTTGKPGFVETGHQMPARFEGAELAQIANTVTRLLDRIGHRYGPAHTELRLSVDGPRIVESNTRPGGDFIWELVLLTRGLDYVKETVRMILGLPHEPRVPVAAAGAVRYFAAEGGILSAIHGLDEASSMPGVVRVSCSAVPGDALGPIRSSDSRQGYVIATGSSREEAIARAEAAHAKVRFIRQASDG